MNNKISIIISTYSPNRYNDLINLLESIKLQTYDNIETIVVVDEDIKLYDNIKSFIFDRYKNAKTVFNPENRGLSYSRNIGILNATGDIVAFTDDDAIADSKWAETIAETFDKDDIGAVTGDVIPIWEYEDMSWFPKELYWMISCSYIMTPNCKCEIERGFGTNMSFKKSMIDNVGMFNTDLGIKGNSWVGGEDTDMFLRTKDIGKKVIFDPNIKILHKIYAHRISMWNIIRRAFNGGISLAAMSRVRQYDINGSTENSYLKRLLFEFYPKGFKKLILRPLESTKQITTVTLVIMAESIGYLSGMYILRNEKGR